MTGRRDAAFFRRYLLGGLDSEDRDAFERDFLMDASLYAELDEVADELAGDYAGGRLTPDERAQFERYALQTEDDRLRVRLARAIQSTAGERSTVRAAPAHGPANERQPWFGFQWGWALVTAVLAMATVVSVLRLWRLQVELTDLSAKLDRTRSEGTALVDAEREARSRVERQLAAATTVAFVLPSVTRAAGEPVLYVPAAATFVRLEHPLETGSSRGPYRAVLRAIGGAEAWSGTLPAISDAAPALSIVVPAIALPPGLYELRLQALTEGAPPPITATFRIRR